MRVRNNKGNVFVGNLPPEFPDHRLAEAFDPVGIVLSAAVARDPETGARLRYGFVDIATERAATQAIAALDGTEIDGCKLNVKPRESKAKFTNGKATVVPRAPRQASQGIQTTGTTRTTSRPAQPRRSQSVLAREQAEAIEPPPQRAFEAVTRPVRRKMPSFQVERRSLPRRV